jgi:hypothetical protein
MEALKFNDLVRAGIEKGEQLLRDLRPRSLLLVPTEYPLHTRFVGDEFRSLMMLEEGAEPMATACRARRRKSNPHAYELCAPRTGRSQNGFQVELWVNFR